MFTKGYGKQPVARCYVWRGNTIINEDRFVVALQVIQSLWLFKLFSLELLLDKCKNMEYILLFGVFYNFKNKCILRKKNIPMIALQI